MSKECEVFDRCLLLQKAGRRKICLLDPGQVADPFSFTKDRQPIYQLVRRGVYFRVARIIPGIRAEDATCATRSRVGVQREYSPLITEISKPRIIVFNSRDSTHRRPAKQQPVTINFERAIRPTGCENRTEKPTRRR